MAPAHGNTCLICNLLSHSKGYETLGCAGWDLLQPANQRQGIAKHLIVYVCVIHNGPAGCCTIPGVSSMLYVDTHMHVKPSISPAT